MEEKQWEIMESGKIRKAGIREKWKNLWKQRKVIWKKYQAAVWIEVIFLGTAAVCSEFLYQNEWKNQTGTAESGMEDIQNEIWRQIKNGEDPDGVRRHTTEYMMDTINENGHVIYGIDLNLYNASGGYARGIGKYCLDFLWRTNTEEGVKEEWYSLEDYFSEEDLFLLFTYFRENGGDRTGKNYYIREVNGWYGNSGEFRPVEVVFGNYVDEDAVYILKDETQRISGDRLVTRVGNLLSDTLENPEQTEIGYFSMNIYDQEDIYNSAETYVTNIVPFLQGEYEEESWCEGSESWRMERTDGNSEIGAYTCSIYADVPTMIRDEGNLKRILSRMWMGGQCFAAGIIAVYLYVRKKKEALAEMHHTFINAIAHEMKTPAAVLKNTAECLQAGIRPEKTSHYLEIIEQEADHMNELLTSMLTYTRVTDSFYQLQKEDCSLEQLAREISRHSVDIMERKQISLIWDVNCPEIVKCDRKLMEMVLDNLISNAAKFCVEGGVVRISLTGRGISIYNEGMEIPEEEIAHIWEPMYKGDVSRNCEQGSAGMGLAISEAVLKQHGAEYGVRNVSGGVEFYIHM